MKKKLLTLCLAACMVLSMTACQKDEDKKDTATEENEEVNQDAIGTSTLTKLGEYQGLGYDPYDTTVTDEEVEAQVQTMLTSVQIPEEIVTETSYVNIDYVGKKDDEAFDGGTASDVTLSIENSGYIDGFAESIVGMKVGETKDCPMTFPEDYHSEELKGQDVVFTITVNECYRYADAVNDEFLENSEYDSADAVYAAAKETCQSAKEETAQSEMEYQLIEAAIANSTFDLNEDEIAVYVDDMESQYSMYAAQYGYDLESFVEASGMTMDDFDEQNREIALLQIQRPLVLTAVAEAEGLEVTDDNYEELAQKYVEYYGYETVSDLEEAYTKEIVMQQLLADLGLNHLVEHAVANEPAEAE